MYSMSPVSATNFSAIAEEAYAISVAEFDSVRDEVATREEAFNLERAMEESHITRHQARADMQRKRLAQGKSDEDARAARLADGKNLAKAVEESYRTNQRERADMPRAKSDEDARAAEEFDSRVRAVADRGRKICAEDPEEIENLRLVAEIDAAHKQAQAKPVNAESAHRADLADTRAKTRATRGSTRKI
jgi:hypothetical protein